MSEQLVQITPARVAKIARYWPAVAGGKALVPISMQVALTDSCFNRCIGCGHPSRVQKYIKVNDWLSFLDNLPRPLESVCYSGGDPMAYPDFNKVMAWHIVNNVAFGCTITGYVPPFIDLTRLAKAEWIRVSLDAIDPFVYSLVRGKTPLHKVLASIDDMLAAGVHVALGITLHPDNEGQLPKILAWAETKGIIDIDSRYAYPQSNPRWPDVDLETRGIQPFQHCKASLYQLYIDSDGSVFPCSVTAGDTRAAAEGYALGNILSEQWSDIWQRVVAYSETTDLPKICSTCCRKNLSEINSIAEKLPLTQSFF